MRALADSVGGPDLAPDSLRAGRDGHVGRATSGMTPLRSIKTINKEK
ncbi:hypothetical protein [Nonomuraea dietziae]